jgi:mannose-6-phosphate isomerase-like protein (cupin superfamily)
MSFSINACWIRSKIFITSKTAPQSSPKSVFSPGSLVEHPMSAHALAAPLYKHAREDEYSYILEGSVGALLGDNVIIGKTGDLIFKPRNQWHTFWNAGDTPARILEIISPAGFEKFFQELIDLGGAAKAPPQAVAQLCGRYELEIDFGGVTSRALSNL